MAYLSSSDKSKFERLFGMKSGYVLEFSNETLYDFVLEITQKDIYDDKYNQASGSKANRIRAFWSKESDFIVGALLLALLNKWRDNKLLGNNEILANEQRIYEDCLAVAKKLHGNNTVENINVLHINSDDRSFNTLAKEIRNSIEKNEPELALDRLHTYVVKFIRELCSKHNIQINKEESLNAIFGKYVRFICDGNKIESLMAERILKYSINILEAFNDVRNNRSLAHDNSVLNYDESLLIVRNVTSSIEFIETIENRIALEAKASTPIFPF